MAHDLCNYPRCLAGANNGHCPRAAACQADGLKRYVLVECPPAPGPCEAAGPPPCEPPACPPPSGPLDACGGPSPNPKRPTRPAGGDSGRLDDPTGLSPGDLHQPNPPGVWVGPRKDMPLPYLLIRAHPGDLGARPLGVPFWESPDIFILPGVDPSAAPAIPKRLGSIAVANRPNTLYAHVWNFGHGAASEALVEFYWCDPSLGINAGSAQLIAQVPVTLGSKCSGRCHAVVKCPVAWRPSFVNGGHECLVVRVWDNPSDMLGSPGFDASANRHVGQRNIHVVTATAAAAANMALQPLMAKRSTAAGDEATLRASKPLDLRVTLKVGALYQEPAQITVERVAPHSMPWLQLQGGERGKFPATALPTGTALLSSAYPVGGGVPLSGLSAQHCVSGDDQAVVFTANDLPPEHGQAHVYRISATQGGVLFGGYTVVVLGA